MGDHKTKRIPYGIDEFDALSLICSKVQPLVN